MLNTQNEDTPFYCYSEQLKGNAPFLITKGGLGIGRAITGEKGGVYFVLADLNVFTDADEIPKGQTGCVHIDYHVNPSSFYGLIR